MTEPNRHSAPEFPTKHRALFLDRDGVINVRKEGGYILHPAEFVFIEGVPQAIKKFTLHFGHIFIVTNQRGIGKGLMSVEDLNIIHSKMIDEIYKAGGRIDRIYFCPDTQEESPDRKPNPGMGHRAKHEFPDFEWTVSVMVGDSLSDMLFGKNLGMQTVFIGNPQTPSADAARLIDARFPDLLAFAESLDQ